MKKEIIASIDGLIKDNIKDVLSKKYYRFLKRQNCKFYLNDNEVYNYSLCKMGDRITIEFDDFINKEEQLFNDTLDIIYENDDFMIINKKEGLNTIPSKSEPVKSLYNAIYTYLKEKGTLKTIHIITRLDKDTSGLVLVALNKETALLLNKSHYQMNKIYYALAEGQIEEDTFIIEKPIKKQDGSTKRIIASDGKYAKTEFKVIKKDGNQTLLEVKLYTGRTHQIRVHLASINYPIKGDVLYGKEGKRLYLHAGKLNFILKGKEWSFMKMPEWPIIN